MDGETNLWYCRGILISPLPITLLHIGVAGLVSCHVALRKRNVRAAIGWIGLVWLVPLAGAILYFLLGINRISRTGASLGLESHVRAHDQLYPSTNSRAVPHSGFSGMNRLAETVTHRPLTSGNRIEPLIHGDQAYPVMLEALRGAQKSVSFSSYIFDNDRAGTEFISAFTEAKSRGVAVRVLVDGVGARYSKVDTVNALRKKGVSAAKFLPNRPTTLFRYANLRNHRKLMVVDGTLGFTGGMNIREGNLLAIPNAHPIRDIHFKVQGPIVEDLQRAFAIDWAFTTGERLDGPDWFPRIPVSENEEGVFARGIPDGPDTDMDNMRLVILGALAAAQYSVKIVTPYFLPDSAITAALQTTALRGVQVDIILPEKSNIFFMDWAMEAQIADLIDRGCRITLSPPPFDHSKLFVVDSLWSLIGSTNWDPRSLRLNFEYNLECYDPILAQRLEKLIEERIEQGRPLTAEYLRSLPRARRLRDGFARLLTPYL